MHLGRRSLVQACPCPGSWWSLSQILGGRDSRHSSGCCPTLHLLQVLDLFSSGTIMNTVQGPPGSGFGGPLNWSSGARGSTDK